MVGDSVRTQRVDLICYHNFTPSAFAQLQPAHGHPQRSLINCKSSNLRVLLLRRSDSEREGQIAYHKSHLSACRRQRLWPHAVAEALAQETGDRSLEGVTGNHQSAISGSFLTSILIVSLRLPTVTVTRYSPDVACTSLILRPKNFLPPA